MQSARIGMSERRHFPAPSRTQSAGLAATESHHDDNVRTFEAGGRRPMGAFLQSLEERDQLALHGIVDVHARYASYALTKRV